MEKSGGLVSSYSHVLERKRGLVNLHQGKRSINTKTQIRRGGGEEQRRRERKEVW